MVFFWFYIKVTKWQCRKKPVQTIISYSGDAGLLKIRVIYFLVTLSGHNFLIFQDSLTAIWSCSSPFTRLTVIQGNNCPAFPIITSPSAWYCRPWSLTAYGCAPGLNHGNDIYSIRNIRSDQPPFVRFYIVLKSKWTSYLVCGHWIKHNFVNIVLRLACYDNFHESIDSWGWPKPGWNH